MNMTPKQSGYILLQKPKGISSFYAMKTAQKKLQTLWGEKIKMGHAGTLDPLAQGLLLCAINEGTKLLSELITDDKKYTATIFLGKNSSTDDSEGDLEDIENPRSDIPTLLEIENVLKKFVGDIVQIPPSYSALKINGKRACDRVRNGETVVMKSRNVHIFSITLVSYHFPLLTIQCHVSSGTYIRSLSKDIGAYLRTGAYLTDLIRTEIGAFSLENAVSAENIKTSDTTPFQPQHFSFPFFQISHEQYIDLCSGKSFCPTQIPEEVKDPLFLVGKSDKTVLGLARMHHNEIYPKKMMQLMW